MLIKICTCSNNQRQCQGTIYLISVSTIRVTNTPQTTRIRITWTTYCILWRIYEQPMTQWYFDRSLDLPEQLATIWKNRDWQTSTNIAIEILKFQGLRKAGTIGWNFLFEEIFPVRFQQLTVHVDRPLWILRPSPGHNSSVMSRAFGWSKSVRMLWKNSGDKNSQAVSTFVAIDLCKCASS